MNCLDW
jgi:hypothetical protein